MTITPVIKKHWVVAAFTPPDEDDDIGAIGGVQTFLHTTVEAAKQRAKELAAMAPGSVYVVYEAQWYAFTDETPVNLRRVGSSMVAI